MKYTKDIEPVTVLKREAAVLISRARERATPIVITQSGKPTAVLVDVESYERDRSAFLLLKLMAQGERDYTEGRTVSHAEARKEFHQQLAELRESE
ncbi:type II toxin-antitoxin system Phd/YefM family antitoxin [Paraliomyxa miuraensis]|uniref:type II toxin-antitoxin system Phd/YefM family antitoxin n=1 Tax=Paraliomyxa miuraensis TaxID=376150 RepID=UPI0022520C66|nr:type II toxin-antitoxin system Phd/YefM family antitoxin [Paraliomyxa miuraensis]MCX4241700.1 type II toxin-antitoxin system Phd/YefM family antitoxin [Paraliomyxa miuraensis]